VLVGSSGLFGFETGVPALTEDIDIAVPEGAVARHGREIVQGHQVEAGLKLLSALLERLDA
jgi:hydrogenase maturation factor HypE